MEERMVVHFGCSGMQTESLMKVCACRCEHEKRLMRFFENLLSPEKIMLA